MLKIFNVQRVTPWDRWETAPALAEFRHVMPCNEDIFANQGSMI